MLGCVSVNVGIHYSFKSSNVQCTMELYGYTSDIYIDNALVNNKYEIKL